MVVAHTDLVTAQRKSAVIPSPCQRPSTEQQKQIHTRKTNMTPENGPLEKEIHIGNPSFWMSIYTLIFQACRVLKRIVAMKYPALHSDDFGKKKFDNSIRGAFSLQKYFTLAPCSESVGIAFRVGQKTKQILLMDKILHRQGS